MKPSPVSSLLAVGCVVCALSFFFASPTAAVTCSSSILVQVAPSTALEGISSEMISLMGTGFNSTSLLLLTPPGSSTPQTQTATFINSGELTATLPGSLLTTPGPITIQVQVGSCVTNPLTLLVEPPPSSTLGLTKESNSYVPFVLNLGGDPGGLALDTPGILPTSDAIQEFNLITSTINPEYGRNSGGIVNALIKSGTNSFHGGAFDFYRDTFLNNRNFFSFGPQQPIFHQNVFGGTFGGPLFKDKIFFFTSYQWGQNSVNSLAPLQGTSNAVSTSDPNYQVTDNFTKIIGKHTLKFGFDPKRFQVDNPFFASDSFSAAFVADALGTSLDERALNEARISFNRLNVDFGGAAVGANPSIGNEIGIFPGLFVRGLGSPYSLGIRPVYNSQSTSTGSFGFKMSSLLDMSLNFLPTEGAAIFQDWDGQIRSYACPPGATTCSPTVPGDASIVTLDFVNGHTISYADKWKFHFGLDGHISDGGDGRGYNIQFTRSPSAIKLTDNLGAEIDATVGSNGLVSALSDRFGRTAQFSYDLSVSFSPKLTLEIAPNLGKWRFSYDTNGGMNGITDPNNNQTSVNLSAFLQVMSITDATGKTIKISVGFPSTVVTDALNNQWTYNSDSFFRTMSFKNPLGGMRSRTLDANGFLNSFTNEKGNTWLRINNPDGYPLKETDPLGNPAFATYDGNNNPLTNTDRNGNLYQNTFNSSNLPILTKDPLGGMDQYSYDSKGREIQEIDENGVATTTVYDDTANTITTTLAAGTPQSLTFVSHFDGIGRNIETDYPGGRIDKIQWNALSLPTELDQAVGTPLQRSAFYVYDGNGNLIQSTDFRGIQTKAQYNALNLPIRIDRASSLPEVQTEFFAYDANRNLTQDTLGGITTDYLYDAADQLVKETLANGKIFSRTLDPAGNTASTTDGNGNTNTFQVNALNLLVAANLFDGIKISRTYDKNSNTLGETTNNSSTSYVYDGLNRPTSSVFVDLTNGTTTPISDQYDAVSNVIRITLPDATATQYFYDPLRRPIKAIDRTSGQTLFTYNSSGLLANKALSNGVVTEYLQDVLGRTISLQNFHGSTPLSSQTVIYDPNDNVIQSTSLAGGVTQSHFNGLDWLDKFTAANGSATTYTYAPFGGRTSVTNLQGTKTNSFEAAGWETADAGQTLTNDGNGNLLSDGILTNTFDAFGWLASSTNGTFTDHFLYTPEGFRFFKQDSKGVHRSFPDPATGQRLFEINTNGTTSSTTFFTSVPGGPLISAQTPTQFLFYIQDIFNSSMTITGPTGGILANYTYTPFGQLTNVTDALRNGNEYYFNGQEKDQDTGLYYFGGGRYYNPNRGRFLDQEILQPRVFRFGARLTFK